jgi:hypothetical protein
VAKFDELQDHKKRAEKMATDVILEDNSVNVTGGNLAIDNGSLALGTADPKRPVHVDTGEVHSGGPSGGLSFASRQTGSFVETPHFGERWVWYSDGGVATLWSNGPVLKVTPPGLTGVPGTGLLVEGFIIAQQGAFSTLQAGPSSIDVVTTLTTLQNEINSLNENTYPVLNVRILSPSSPSRVNQGIQITPQTMSSGSYSSFDLTATFTPQIEVFATLANLQKEIDALKADMAAVKHKLGI